MPRANETMVTWLPARAMRALPIGTIHSPFGTGPEVP